MKSDGADEKAMSYRKKKATFQGLRFDFHQVRGPRITQKDILSLNFHPCIEKTPYKVQEKPR
jgi:hypothetical protein